MIKRIVFLVCLLIPAFLCAEISNIKNIEEYWNKFYNKQYEECIDLIDEQRIEMYYSPELTQELVYITLLKSIACRKLNWNSDADFYLDQALSIGQLAPLTKDQNPIEIREWFYLE